MGVPETDASELRRGELLAKRGGVQPAIGAVKRAWQLVKPHQTHTNGGAWPALRPARHLASAWARGPSSLATRNKPSCGADVAASRPVMFILRCRRSVPSSDELSEHTDTCPEQASMLRLPSRRLASDMPPSLMARASEPSGERARSVSDVRRIRISGGTLPSSSGISGRPWELADGVESTGAGTGRASRLPSSRLSSPLSSGGEAASGVAAVRRGARLRDRARGAAAAVPAAAPAAPWRPTAGIAAHRRVPTQGPGGPCRAGTAWSPGGPRRRGPV